MYAVEYIDLAERSVNKERAAELLGTCGTIVEDWEHSEMDVYDLDWRRDENSKLNDEHTN